MELVYLWVEEYKNIHRQGFNFSPRFRCEYNPDTNELTIDENDDYVDIFPDNINVTAIVGKNGSGKSSLLRSIFKNKSFIVFLQDNKLYFQNPDNLIGDMQKIKHYTYTLPKDNKNKTLYGVFFRSTFESLDKSLRKSFNDEEKLIDISDQKIIENISLLLKDKVKNLDTNELFQYIEPNILFYLTQQFDIEQSFKLLKEKVFIKNYQYPQKVRITFPVLDTELIQKNFLNDISDYLKDLSLNNILSEEDIKKIDSNIEDFLSKQKDYFERNQYPKFLLNLKCIQKTIHLNLPIAEALPVILRDFKIDQEKIKEFSPTYKTLFLEMDKVESLLDELSFVNGVVEIELTNTNIDKYILPLIEYNKKSLSILETQFYDFYLIPEQSSGHQHLLKLFGRLYFNIYKIDNDHLILFLDEPDTYLHPQWLKDFINNLIFFLKNNFSKKIHIIFTTHSPFLLSDIPKQNIIFLDTDEEGKCKVVDRLSQTFGANIHTLLSDSFFMKDGLMGEFAKDKINKIIRFLNGDNKFIDFPINQIKKVIEVIGEPFLKQKLLDMYNKKFIKEYKDRQKEKIKKQIEDLNNQLKELDND